MRQFKNPLFALFIILCLSTKLCFSQNNDTQNVQKTIETFFNGMRKGDVAMLQSSLSESCNLSTILNATEGSKIQGGSMEKFVESLKKKDPSVIYDERILSYDIKIDGPMAIAWTPYNFFVNENFSHCGVNVFTLAKGREDNWSIISITDTRRKDPCDL